MADEKKKADTTPKAPAKETTPKAKAIPKKVPAKKTVKKAAQKAESAEATTPSSGFKTASVSMVSLDDINLADETYRFRAALRIGPLADSMKENGLQVPIIVLARGRGQRQYKLLSGFRRCSAALKLGWKEISAVVRDDLDDEGAFKAAVVENTNRKTYSDIDRANVVAEYRRRGFTGGDDVPMAVLGLTKRQQRNLLSLLKLPKTVQASIDDPEQGFSTTHALILRQAKAKYPKLDYGKWIKRVNEESLSISSLKRAVNKEYDGKTDAKGFGGLFRDKGTDGKNTFRFNPVAVNIKKMSDADKAKLKENLEAVLDAMKPKKPEDDKKGGKKDSKKK